MTTASYVKIGTVVSVKFSVVIAAVIKFLVHLRTKVVSPLLFKINASYIIK